MKNLKILILSSGIGLLSACGIVQNPRNVKYIEFYQDRIIIENHIKQRNTYLIKEFQTNNENSAYRFSVEYSK